MSDDARWMRRALQLARLGMGGAAPNPMVGAVLVRDGRVLAEGWHKRAGGPHAEVECLRAFGEGPVPAGATLYVSLEPCVHHGRTPPCTDLIIARRTRRMVVAHGDPNPLTGGRGISLSRGAGITVVTGVGEAEARWTNRRFLTAMERQRPYIILKWARSADGFLDRHPREGRGVQRISSPGTDVLVHRWRSEEQAILVGSRTVVHDDPALTVRHVAGRSPLRIIIDRDGITPEASKVHDGTVPTLLFAAAARPQLRAEQYILGLIDDPLEHVLAELHRRSVRSVLVEGGAALLRRFIEKGLWDEARVIEGTPHFVNGTPAPVLPTLPARVFSSGEDRIALHLNTAAVPDPAWPW